MPLDSQAPLRKRVFGKGLVTYKQDGLLCFDLTIREKTFHEDIALMNKIDSVKSLFVSPYDEFIYLVCNRTISIINIVDVPFLLLNNKEQKQLTLLNNIITIPGIISSCCFDKQKRDYLYVMDQTFIIYTISNSNIIGSYSILKHLFQESVGVHTLSSILFMDIISFPTRTDHSLLLGTSNGNYFYITNCFGLKTSPVIPSVSYYSTKEKKEDFITLIELEAQLQFKFYAVVFLHEVQFILVTYSDKRILVVDSHNFADCLDEDSIHLDSISKMIRVNDEEISYKWIFEGMKGKDIWERRKEEEFHIPIVKDEIDENEKMSACEIQDKVDRLYDKMTYENEYQRRLTEKIDKTTMSELNTFGLEEAFSNPNNMKSTLSLLT